MFAVIPQWHKKDPPGQGLTGGNERHAGLTFERRKRMVIHGKGTIAPAIPDHKDTSQREYRGPKPMGPKETFIVFAVALLRK
jgi:hypothetical protein